MREIENIQKMPNFQEFQILIQDHLKKEQKDAIGSVLISQKFQINQIIVDKGDQADSLVIIAQGKVGVYTDGGKNALFQDNCVRGLTVKAIEESRFFALGRESLVKILDDGVINVNGYCSNLKQIQLFKQINFWIYQTILRLKKGDIIFKKGQQHGELIIVIDGQVSDSNQNTVCDKGKILLDKTVESNGNHDQDYFIQEDGIIAAIYDNIVKKQFDEQQYLLEIYAQGAHNKVNQVKDYQLECGQFGLVYLLVQEQIIIICIKNYDKIQYQVIWNSKTCCQ